MRALGTDPIRKLVVPRVLAGFIMCPILTVVADTVGMLGGWIIALTQLRVSSGVYWSSVVEGLYIQDVYMGIIKPFFLGVVIVTIGCHVGLRTSGGTQGVGRSTTNAVVAASVVGLDRRLLRHAAVDLDPVLMRAKSLAEFGLPVELAEAHAPVVLFDKVNLSFDEKVILRDVTFSVRAGHTKIFLGASGAGKSTILKLMLGPAEAGLGHDLGARAPRRSDGRSAVDAASGITWAWCSRKARCSIR